MMTIVATATLASIGTAGVPGAGMVVSNLLKRKLTAWSEEEQNT